MVFSSLSFLILFIPVTAALYFVIKNRTWRNAVLLLASLIFYSWGEPKLVILMIAVALIAYIGGLLIEKTNSKAVFVITTILILANLFIFKYSGFAAENLNSLGFSISIGNIKLPIGISFYTFQILSYVIDLYWKRIKVQTNYFKLLLYLCFFPQLIAGPIVRYSTIENEITERFENIEDIADGAKRFIIGLSKKVLIANSVAKIAEIIYSAPHGTYDAKMFWLASICYTLQIYYDFSGYSDMAIGLGRIFGFHFLENFDYPYASTSVTEFWRRWHISLSSWFKDYVYIPLGGNRVSEARNILNIFIVWALTGLWHGASWNFVFWGLYYAVLLTIEKHVLSKVLNKLPKFLTWLYTFFVVNMGWVLFNLVDFSELKYALTVMFSSKNYNMQDMIAQNTEILFAALFIPLGLLFMFPIIKKSKKQHYLLYLALLAICIAFILSTSYNPFIYFRF